MTHRNNKRNNRHNRQRNNKTELSPFASMLFGALLCKGTEMIAEKMAEEAKKTPDIHAEGITNKDINNINNGNATLSKLRIPADGSAVEYPVPDNLQFFFAEDGKLMVRKKIEGDEKPTKDDEGNPITYDDILLKLYFGKTAYWALGKDHINEEEQGFANYRDAVNCTTLAQAKRLAAFNKLQNIAKYLNDGWKPKFDGNQQNWNIVKDNDTFIAMHTTSISKACVYFKSEDLTKEAIRLMGKESLNDLFSTDW
nr:hypothetical protein [Prevotella sp.]